MHLDQSNQMPTMQQDDLLRMSQILRHRLRNIASGIRGAINLIQEEAEGQIANDLHEYFPLIIRECDSLQDIATRLNMLLDQPVQQYGMDDIAQITDTVLHELAPFFPNVEFQKTYPPVSIKVPGGMALALRELLTNACEAAPRGIVAVKICTQNKMATWTVCDSGPGIAGDQRQQAFLPFFTTRPRHLGLGLPLARRIAQAYGGTCELTTESGSPSEWTIAISCPMQPLSCDSST